MSKAFLRESDLADDSPLPAAISLLPSGTKNLMTAGGAERLRQELVRLVDVERPPLVAQSTGDTDAKRELQGVDQRIRHLRESLRTAEVVETPNSSDQVVHFGSTATVRDANGEESRFRIVGVDETDVDQGWVSWVSPLARALLNARVGTRVTFATPAGDSTLNVLAVE